MRRGFTLVELVVILALFSVSAMMLLSLSCDRERPKKKSATGQTESGTTEAVAAEQEEDGDFREYPADSGRRQSSQIERAKLTQCKSNLKQLGMGLQMYVMDEGRGVYYPDANGGGFVARLYQAETLTESLCFQCSGSGDRVSSESIQSLKAEDEGNAISYAGRKNANQREYPGLFRVHRDTSLTSLASDDWQGTNNHCDGQTIAVLYQDGHVDHVTNIYARGYKGYAMGQQQEYRIAHPLTN